MTHLTRREQALALADTCGQRGLDEARDAAISAAFDLEAAEGFDATGERTRAWSHRSRGARHMARARRLVAAQATA